MAYKVSIIWVNREYSGLGWVQYDTLFQKHAALKVDTKWSIISTTLYARCFTGASREVVRCKLFWATSYNAKDCSYLAGADSTIEFYVQNIEDSLQALLQQCSQPTFPRSFSEICSKFNNKGCTYLYYRHTLMCVWNVGVLIQKQNGQQS